MMAVYLVHDSVDGLPLGDADGPDDGATDGDELKLGCALDT